MGGLFRAPRPPVVVPPPAPPPAAAPPAPAPAAIAEAAREETRRRASQGLAGTIATSPRGVLDPAPIAPPIGPRALAAFATPRRSLLGE